MPPANRPDLDGIRQRYEAAQQSMPESVAAAKRVHLQRSEWMDNWWVGYGKDESCQIEGTPNHWRWLAMLLLGLADRRDSPYSADKPTPEVVPELLAYIERLQDAVKEAIRIASDPSLHGSDDTLAAFNAIDDVLWTALA